MLDMTRRGDAPARSAPFTSDSVSRRSFLVACSAAIAACTSETAPPYEVSTWGERGTRDGEFIRPRAIGVHMGRVYVVDTTGRVQAFTRDGVFSHMWSMPEYGNGTPTCISFARDGRVLIPDTHYSRIVEYATDGTLLKMWGKYGAEPGQFIYPTGIAESPHGLYYISEYGVGAERVQVFDRDGAFQRQWGSHGTEPGQFNRAMAIVMRADHVVYVADTTNHRVQAFDTQGRLIRVIGAPGIERGRLKFPQSIAFAPDGSLVICEYGANRISRFSSEGAFLGAFGVAGRAPGSFHAPRGVAVSDDGEVFVADTDNHRIHRFPLEAIA